jgi:hypothetical protein
VRQLRSALPIVLAAAALCANPRLARADEPAQGSQIAQSLFDDGRVLMDAGRYAEACPKFADSHRLDPAGGTLLNLALCYELEGKTASAWAAFRDALSVAVRDQRRDRQELAEQHIAALGAKLTRLAVMVPKAVAASAPEITFDRANLPSAAWNTAIPVDPGEHRIVVTAEGHPRWETSVLTTEPGRTYTAEVSLAERAPLASGPGEPERPSASLPSHRRSTAFWIVLGGAGLSVATSIVTGVLALDANAYVKDNCSNARAFCRVDDAKDAGDRARSLAWASTATLIVGAGAGLVAFLLPLENAAPLRAAAAVRFQHGAALATVEVAPLRW